MLRVQRSDSVKKLLVAWCCTIVIACASASKHSAQSGMPLSPHAQIDDLATKIETERTRMNLPAPAIAPVEPMGHPDRMAVTPSSTDSQCHPAATDTCKESCTLADSICGNATKICTIAQELAGDTWADQKCSSAKTTCDAAHAKCCGCQL